MLDEWDIPAALVMLSFMMEPPATLHSYAQPAELSCNPNHTPMTHPVVPACLMIILTTAAEKPGSAFSPVNWEPNVSTQ